MQDKLMELCLLSSQKNIEFTYTNEKEKSNYIILEENKLIINISDFEDKKFVNKIQNKIDELKKVVN